MYKPGLLFLMVLLSACEKGLPFDVPPAQPLTRDASGYYCLMTVINHSGPKGQVFLNGTTQPLWFTSVRETIAFTLSPEEPKNIAAIYVNDMSDADWDNPGVNNWIDARKAWYVLGSGRTGGMNVAEAIPFSSKASADLYARQQGGEVYVFNAIPQDYIQ